MPATTYKVKGRVTDSRTRRGLQNADVRIVAGSPNNFGKRAVTNANGRYEIPGVEPGRIFLEASLSYTPLEKDKTISGNTTVDFKLVKS